jgi:hypothetical protein
MEDLCGMVNDAQKTITAEQEREDKGAELALKAAEAFYDYLNHIVPDCDVSVEELYEGIRDNERIAKMAFGKQPKFIKATQSQIEDIIEKLGL